MSPAGLASQLEIDHWRQQIPILGRMIPMNHCSQAPLTAQARSAALRYLDSWDQEGMDWTSWLEEVEGARCDFAALIGADPDCVGLSTSVSEAVSSLASALDFGGDRDTIVLSGAEFPTVRQVWLAQETRGAKLRTVSVTDGTIQAGAWKGAIDERTRVVSACHAYYQNGFVQDVAEIGRLAHAKGAYLFVDAYQTLGTRPIDVRQLGADFLASGCLKYLLGTPGLAFLYVRPDLIESLRPTVTGWFGRAQPFDFEDRPLDWAASARRFDTGTPPLINAYICAAGMKIIREAGPECIEAVHLDHSRRLLEGGLERGLLPHGPRDAAAKTVSTAFVVPPESGLTAEDVGSRLREKRIIAAPRGPAIRLAPHFYTLSEEIDAALDALAGIIA